MEIKIRELCKSYGKKKALQNFDATFENGIYGILGPNGAGKSTLFRCMLGFLPHYQGSISLCGRDVRHLPRRELAHLAAYIPQSSQPLFDYTVRDTVLMGAAGGLEPLRQPGRQQLETAQRMMELVGIAPLADRGIRRISGGERQLTLIARALAQQARILLMDEPAANLDYGNQFRLLQQVRRLTEQGYTVLLSTHNPEHASLRHPCAGPPRRHGGGLRPGGGDADGGAAAHPVPYPSDGGAGAGHRCHGPQLRL